MKIRIAAIAILLSVTTALMAVAPPKAFKGTIKYKITYSGDEINDQMKAFLPKMMTIKVRGNSSKTEMSMGMGKTVKIKNGSDKSVTTLLDMMGQKIAVASTFDEVMAELADEPDVTLEFKDEQKEILGYMCNKVVIKFSDTDGSKQRLTAYYTDALGSNSNHWDTKQFSEIEGFLLEFQTNTPQFTMTFTASSIEKGGVSKKEFEVPEDFEMKTREEVEAMFGGM